MWFAGIDWADDHHDAVVLTDQGQLLGALRVPHTAEGLDHLTRFLRGGASTSGAAELDQLTQVLAQGHYPHPRQKAEQLAALLQAPQLHALPGVARAKARLMAALRAQLAVLTTQVAAFDQAIQQLFAQHADSAVFASLPGAGRRLAPRLLAEWGADRTRYASAASVRALAGTAPVLFQSGAFRGGRRRRACVNALRQAPYHFARASVLCEPWAKAYYQRKRAQGQTHAMALRAVANQWVRIIYAMWQARQPYQRAIFLAAQHAHGGLVA